MTQNPRHKLSIIVPVYNEEKHLENIVTRLLGSSVPVEREWIFIDDCSTDRSKAILKELSARHGFRLLEQPVNMGKGAAVIRGIRAATGTMIMIQDADFEYDPADVPALIEPVMNEIADVVYGSRFKKSSAQVHRTYHYFANRLLTLMSNLFSGIYLTDMETCYKVFRADLVQSMNLTSQRFGIEVELTAYIAKVRARIFELPISYFPRTRLQGKKISWKDGLAALYFIFKYNKFISTEKAFSKLPGKYFGLSGVSART